MSSGKQFEFIPVTVTVPWSIAYFETIPSDDDRNPVTGYQDHLDASTSPFWTGLAAGYQELVTVYLLNDDVYVNDQYGYPLAGYDGAYVEESFDGKTTWSDLNGGRMHNCKCLLRPGGEGSSRGLRA